MTNSALYRIEEMCSTTGEWSLIDEQSCGLTREECDKRLEFHMRNEVNPNYLKVVREK